MTAYVLAQPTVYSASTVVALRPKGVRPAQADVVLLTAPRYVALATSPYVVNQVARQVKIDAEELSNGISVTVEPNTANLLIKVTLREREATATLANALAKAVLDRASGDTILAAQILSRAVEPDGESGPKRYVTLGSGTVAAVVIGAGAAWLFNRHMRRRARLVRGVASVRAIVPGQEKVSADDPSAEEVPAAPTTAVPAQLRTPDAAGTDSHATDLYAVLPSDVVPDDEVDSADTQSITAESDSEPVKEPSSRDDNVEQGSPPVSDELEQQKKAQWWPS
ncbi:MAG: hypothetical protein ACRDTD_21425 [Pseudonocardiaceae bacterium]